MRSSKWNEPPVTGPSQPAGQDNGRELSAAWKSLNQTKAALRHIENRLEAAPGSGVLLESVMDTKKSSGGATRKVSRRDGRRMEDCSQAGGTSKSRTRSRRSPDKSSRSPLRNTTQESNVRRSNCVEFKEPLVSYREATPPPLTSSQLEGHSLQSEVALLPLSSDLSQLVYRRDTRDKQTSGDLDTTHSSALDSTVLRYLNDRPALDALRSPERAATAVMGPYREEAPEDRAKAHTPEGLVGTSVSSSPGSASQRLENLRRRQPDDKLEKLKERIRRQREHLAEATERDSLLGYLERPVGFAGSTDTTATSAAKVRKVAAAPPAPVYQGFNSTETKIRTPDGKVWREKEYQNLSREIYRDLSHQFSESAKPKQQPQEKAKERKPSKPVRKVHKSVSVPNAETKPVISTTSWREGQKLVKMVLGPPLRLPRDQKPEVADRQATIGSHPRSNSYPRPDLNRRSRPSSSERSHSRDRITPVPKSGGPAENRALSTDLLSADIRGILDDLQLERRAGGQGPVEPRTGSDTRVRTTAWMAGGSSLRGSRSASPAKRNKSEPSEPGAKKRHYDADSVRQYIARQQEERKRRQLEERKAQKEEAERRSQRLQELYRKQREGVANKGQAVVPGVVPEGPAQKRLQETYTKLLLEHAELGEEPPQAQPTTSAVIYQQRPLYQPSGESDKENRRQERPQSASSSSDLSLSEPQPPPLSRNELGLGVPSWLQPDHLSRIVRPPCPQSPPADQLFSQLLDLKKAAVRQTRPQPCTLTGTANASKKNRIEALKATAASLSTRIESEARKLAGAGINYGCTGAADVTARTQPQDDGRWADPVSPPVRDEADTGDQLSLRIQRLLSAAQSTYDGALPGVGNLQGFQEQRQRTTAPGDRPPTAPGLSAPKQPEAGKTNTHNSSCDSISEGPLLSECSLSEGDVSPGTNTKAVPNPAECLGALDFCAGQRESFQPISHFRREAEKYPALSPIAQAQDSSQGPWEELAKGSPHSVINIFTKNHLYSHANVGAEERGDRNSPSARNGISAASAADGAALYEDDFVSLRSSGSNQSKRGHNGRGGIASGNSHYEELISRRSPFADLPSVQSSGSTPQSSPNSRSSVKRGGSSDKSDATLLEEQRSPCSLGSEAPSRDSRRCGSASESSIHSLVKNTFSDCTLGGASGHSLHSLGLDSKKSPRSLSPAGSPPGSGSPRVSPGSTSLAGADSPGQGSGSPQSSARPGSSSSLSSAARGKSPANSGRTEPKAAGDLHYTPGVLQQRMSAELNYLESIEESVRQLGDVERLRGVSLAQQESVSLAQILKAQQQRHERDLYELKVKAEVEALETQRQLEETRQKAARAHIELQENMAQTQQQSLEGVQDAAIKMINQQAESVRYTAEAARQIKEMTELARSQIAGAIGLPAAAPITPLLDQQRQHHQSFMKQLQPCADADVSRSEVRARTEDPPSSLDSRSGSIPSRRPTLSGGESSSHLSPSLASSDQRGWRKAEAGSSAAEEEAHTAIDESLPSDSAQSLLDDKDTTSIATEYSLKFDESMTEDEIEERSFRSLLPSESHRRGATERKRDAHEESEEDPSQERTSVPEISKQPQTDGSMVFSSGQDSFSRFTMDMVRQYMKEEEVRAHHQSSLLRLRQKALKEKTKAELAWLEHQKRRLRDKGEDDKMPPIRKKQRGLLLKLQQEQAEIKRLQEANKAARKERQLLLKQQEDIERMRHTTLKLKERLKYAGDTPPETSVSELVDGASSPSVAMTEGDMRSTSPLSVSGSETSSIMQKLKKMRSHMDEKFLTKREQGLMQRRRHAEELLQWKQRLDAEEAEVRRMEKQALAAWDRERPRNQPPEHRDGSGQLSPPPQTDTDSVSEAKYSPVVTGSSVHTELSGSQRPDSPPTGQPGAISELPSSQHSPTIYSQDFDSPSGGKTSPSPKASLSTNAHPEGSSSSSKMQLRSSSRTTSHDPKATDTTPATHTEPMSDQSDIESRIRALKEELRKRKTVVYQLKKEQKKRHKERLKAQEASLLKQLESYNDFIEKTKTELNKEPDLTPLTKPQIKTPTSACEKPKIKPLLPYRPETSKDLNVVSDSEKAEKTLPDSPVEQAELTPSGLSKNISGHEDSSDDDPPTVTQTPMNRSPEHSNGLSGLLSPDILPSLPSVGGLPLMEPARLQATGSGDESVVLEELDSMKSEGSEHSHSSPEDHLLEWGPASQQCQSLSEPASSKNGKQRLSPTSSLDDEEKSFKSRSPVKEQPYTPEAEVIPSKKDILAEGEETSPAPSADGYLEDFESSVDLSLGEDNQGSKPTSPSYQDTVDVSHSAEEEIVEELSERSVITSGSPHSEQILDLKRQEPIVSQENVISSTHYPTISPFQTVPSPALDEMPNFTIGDRVLVSNVQPGTLRFKGHTSFANGFWAGVELDKSEGSNNGTYDDVVYFECPEGHGIFAPPDKISHLPERFEIYVDTTEDEDSFLDDQSDNELKKPDFEKEMNEEETNLGNNRQVTSHMSSGGNKPADLSDGPAERPKNLTNSHEVKQADYPISNGRTKTIILDLEDVPTSLFITDIQGKIALGRQTLDETTTLIERTSLDVHRKSTSEQTDLERDALSSFADKLLNTFMKDAVKQFTQIRKAKEAKVAAANQMKVDLFNGEEGRQTLSQSLSVEQGDGLPFFLESEPDEQLSSPELCNRPESPVLGASGQEELAKRLAELELSRELLDELGDEQDWFDEDYGLSSRRELQKQKQRQQEEEEDLSTGSIAMGDQAKTPPRPELPLQPKLPEQPAMVVPHSAPEVEKLVHAATQEIWDRCKLGQGTETLPCHPVPKPSEEYLGCDAQGLDQEGQCVRSYRQAVYDLTWEIIQEVFAEDPNAHQPQWVKPRRTNSSYFHRVKSTKDITRVKTFITTEVLRLYGLKKDRNQKTDWQKMLKFGRKKRDRVDHILVQELHEEESQWVNYDEDELYVKMQLADGIFDALIKDTAEVLTHIQQKRSKTVIS